MSNKVFTTIPRNGAVKIKSSNFDMSYGLASTCNFGQIVPIMCQPVVPGDKFKLSSDYLVRVAPMLAPLMHRVNIFVNWFYVPDYLIWTHAWDWIIGNTDANGVEYVPPTLNFGPKFEFEHGSLADYLGCPSGVSIPSSMSPSSLPFRAYLEVYNWYFRNENIQKEIEYDRGDTETLESSKLLNTVRFRNWAKDYYTSALPNPQEGDDPTYLPVSGRADVKLKDASDIVGPQTIRRRIVMDEEQNEAVWRDDVMYTPDGMNVEPSEGQSNYLRPGISDSGLHLGYFDDGASGMYIAGDDNGSSSEFNNQAYLDPNGTLLADLERVETTIQDFRTANRIQAFKEALNRGGNRPNEFSRYIYGVHIDDLTINRPIYLGGGRSPLMISEVLQTSEGTENSPQGNMAGRGLSANSGFGFRRRFKYFGWVIGTMSVMPKASYFQGMPKKFLIKDKFDLPNPYFDNLGEDAIQNGELYVNHSNPTGTFGYTPRYAAWKFNQDEIHGDFRGNLNFWTMARNFGNGQNLNEDFINTKDNIPYTPFAVQDKSVSHIWFQFFHNLKIRRHLSYYGVPKLV